MGPRSGWAARKRWTVGSASIRSRHSRTAGKSAYIAFFFGSEANGVSAGQQIIIRQADFAAEQKALAARQLALHYLQ